MKSNQKRISKTTAKKTKRSPRQFERSFSPPKQFNIFGHTIKIRYSDILLQKSDNVGETFYRTNEIVLQKNSRSVIRPDTQIQQTYLHEVMHIIFNEIGEGELRNNEKLVDLIANALHQVLTTSKY
jgi:hypothetical protein